MTPADIERMAREAGGSTGWQTTQPRADPELSDDDIVFDAAALTRFAALVRAQALDEAQQLVQANALACADGSLLQVYLASNAAAIRALGEKQ